MEILDGSTLFWLIALGMVAGAITKVVMWNKGLTIYSNLIGGVLGTVIVGGFCIELQIPGSMMLSLMGVVSILFVANVFFLQEEHEAHEH